MCHLFYFIPSNQTFEWQGKSPLTDKLTQEMKIHYYILNLELIESWMKLKSKTALQLSVTAEIDGDLFVK